MNAPEYRSHVGMVFQSFNLFNNMTVLENCMVGQVKVLRRSKEQARQQAMKYLEKVGMAPYINAKPKQLSGGQKQRISIARVFLKNPPILIFDEATSALDNITQKIVSEALDGLKCTRIVIAHRLSTIRQCDRIVVLDGGRITEDGTYEELIAKNGFFAELVERQRVRE